MMRTALPPIACGPRNLYGCHSRSFAGTAHWINLFDEPVQIVLMAHLGGTVAGLIAASFSAGSGPLMQPIRFVRIGSVCVVERFLATESIASG